MGDEGCVHGVGRDLIACGRATRECKLRVDVWAVDERADRFVDEWCLWCSRLDGDENAVLCWRREFRAHFLKTEHKQGRTYLCRGGELHPRSCGGGTAARDVLPAV